MFHVSFFQFFSKVDVFILLFIFFLFYSVVSRNNKVDNFANSLFCIIIIIIRFFVLAFLGMFSRFFSFLFVVSSAQQAPENHRDFRLYSLECLLTSRQMFSKEGIPHNWCDICSLFFSFLIIRYFTFVSLSIIFCYSLFLFDSVLNVSRRDKQFCFTHCFILIEVSSDNEFYLGSGTIFIIKRISATYWLTVQLYVTLLNMLQFLNNQSLNFILFFSCIIHYYILKKQLSLASSQYVGCAFNLPREIAYY